MYMCLRLEIIVLTFFCSNRDGNPVLHELGRVLRALIHHLGEHRSRGQSYVDVKILTNADVDCGPDLLKKADIGISFFILKN